MNDHCEAKRDGLRLTGNGSATHGEPLGGAHFKLVIAVACSLLALTACVSHHDPDEKTYNLDADPSAIVAIADCYTKSIERGPVDVSRACLGPRHGAQFRFRKQPARPVDAQTAYTRNQPAMFDFDVPHGVFVMAAYCLNQKVCEPLNGGVAATITVKVALHDTDARKAEPSFVIASVDP